MSTPNFRLPNTKVHYVIGVEEELDEFLYDDVIESIKEELDQIENGNGAWADGWRGDRHTIYSFEFPLYDRYYKEWCNPSVNVTVESGYYQGSMFDIDTDDLYEHTEALTKTQQLKLERLCRKIERVLSRHCTKLVRTAVFSNGEAIYEKASPRAVIKAIATNNY